MPDELDVRLGRVEKVDEMPNQKGAGDDEENKEEEKVGRENVDKKTTVESTPTPDEDAVEDAKALARYNKRMGTSYASWDEVEAEKVKPANVETEEQKREKRNKAKYQFALEKNILTTTELENFIADSHKAPRDLVYAAFAAEHAGEKPATIQAKFEKLYGEDLEDDGEDSEKISSFVKERRQADLKREAARILRKTYPSVYSLDQKFDEHLNTVKAEKERERQLTQLALTYKSDIESIVAGIKSKKVTVTHDGDTFETDVPYNPEIVKKVKEEFLDINTLSEFTAKYSKETVQIAFMLRLNQYAQDNITEHVAKAYHAAQMTKKKEGRNVTRVPETILGANASTREPDELDRRLGITQN